MKKILAFIICFLFSSLSYSAAPWTEYSGTPVLAPTGSTWENITMGEPAVLKLGANNFLMVYPASGSTNTLGAIGTATSTDGRSWIRNPSNPLIGNGVGGESGAAVRASLYQEGGIIYLLYSNADAGGDIMRQQSADSGATWTGKTKLLDKTVSPPTNVDGYANSSLTLNGGTYDLMVEAHHTSGTTWQIYHLTSSSVNGPFTFAPNTPLISLQIAAGGMYGGPCMRKVGNTYHLSYHAAPGSGTLPTDIYFATSTDKINWTPNVTPVFPRSGEINLGSFPSGIDQTDDLWYFEADGVVYGYYGRGYNPVPYGDISLATYNGTLNQLFGITNTSISGSTVLKNIKMN